MQAFAGRMASGELRLLPSHSVTDIPRLILHEGGGEGTPAPTRRIRYSGAQAARQPVPANSVAWRVITNDQSLFLALFAYVQFTGKMEWSIESYRARLGAMARGFGAKRHVRIAQGQLFDAVRMHVFAKASALAIPREIGRQLMVDDGLHHRTSSGALRLVGTTDVTAATRLGIKHVRVNLPFTNSFALSGELRTAIAGKREAPDGLPRIISAEEREAQAEEDRLAISAYGVRALDVLLSETRNPKIEAYALDPVLRSLDLVALGQAVLDRPPVEPISLEQAMQARIPSQS